MSIELCLNAGCPLARSCNRIKETPDPSYQTWRQFKPEKAGRPCEDYWRCRGFMPVPKGADARN